MKDKILAILTKELNGFWFAVSEYGFLGSKDLAIRIAAKDFLINGVEGQRPQAVSLTLDLTTLELQPQVFGGCGGQCIHRQPNRNLPDEKHLAMKSVKIPFRKPQRNEEAILKAITKFCQNYKQTLIDNIDVLTDQKIVDYQILLQQ